MMINLKEQLTRLLNKSGLTIESERVRVKKLQQSRRVNTFDIDGVIFINKDLGGVHPGPHDIIITGRSIEESEETFAMLESRGITNPVFFNPIPFDKKTRKSSGQHKAKVINMLLGFGYEIGCHFEDDPIQAEEIRDATIIPVIMIGSNEFTNLQNVRHTEF